MKTVAIADDGYAAEAYYRALFASIQAKTGADHILVIINGDIDRDGYPSAVEKRIRVDRLRAAGAGAVICVPACASLLRDTLYVFALVVLLQKLGCVQEYILCCRNASEELFYRTAQILMDEPHAYRTRMKALQREGNNADDVLSTVCEEILPGAGAFLQDETNRISVMIYNQMVRSYSPVKPVLLCTAPYDLPKVDPAVDVNLLARFAQKCTSDTVSLTEYFGGCASTTRHVGFAMDRAPASFTALSEEAAYDTLNALSIRRHLLNELIGYRKLDNFVCVTYNYVPYLQVLSADAEMEEMLYRHAQTTVLGSGDLPKEADKIILHQTETAAEQLYQAVRV